MSAKRNNFRVIIMAVAILQLCVIGSGTAVAESLSSLGACEDLKPRRFNRSDELIRALDLTDSARLSSFLAFEAFQAKNESGTKTINPKAIFTWAAARLGISVKSLYTQMHNAIDANDSLKASLGGTLLVDAAIKDPEINARVEKVLAEMFGDGSIGVKEVEGALSISEVNAQNKEGLIILSQAMMEKSAIEGYAAAFEKDGKLAAKEAGKTKSRARSLGYLKAGQLENLERLYSLNTFQLQALGVKNQAGGALSADEALSSQQKSDAQKILEARMELFPAMFNQAQKERSNSGLPGVGGSKSTYADRNWLESQLQGTLGFFNTLEPTGESVQVMSRQMVKTGLNLELAGQGEASQNLQQQVEQSAKLSGEQVDLALMRVEEMILEANRNVARGNSLYASQLGEMIHLTLRSMPEVPQRIALDAFDVITKVGSAEAINAMISDYDRSLGSEVVDSAYDLLTEIESNDLFRTTRIFASASDSFSTVGVREAARNIDTVLELVNQAKAANQPYLQVDGRNIRIDQLDVERLTKQQEALAMLHREMINKQAQTMQSLEKAGRGLEKQQALRRAVVRARSSVGARR